MDWYDQAAEILLKQLQKSETISGIEFLADYFLTYFPNDFREFTGEDSEKDGADSYARECIDEFQKHLKEQYSQQIRVSKRYQWSLQKNDEQPAKQTIHEEFNYSLDLTKDEEILLKKSNATLNKSDLKHIDSLHSKILGTGDKEKIAEVSLKLAALYELGDSDNSTKAEKWLNCAEHEIELGKKYVHQRYEKAAYLYALDLKSDLSANCFSAASSSNSLKKNEKIEYLRKARLQYEAAGNPDKAASMYSQENDLKLQNSPIYKNFPLRLFKWVSDYGESPKRVLYWAIGVIIVWSIIYFCNGMYSSGSFTQELSSEEELALKAHDFIVNKNSVSWDEALKISTYYSVVTFTTLGYGDFSPGNTVVRTFSAIEAVLGLLLTSLFMVTVVRKYSR